MTQMDLCNNKLSYLENDTFYGLRYLEELDLTNNRIIGFDKKPFRGLSRLKNLPLSNNRIRSINNMMFTSTWRLKFLYLDNNNITAIAGSVFSRQGYAQYLTFKNNPLNVLRKGCFDGLKRLSDLILKNCSVHMIEEGVFDAMEKRLTNLDLSFNNLKNISFPMFERFYRLLRLNLGRNQLDYLHPDTFKGQKFLLELYLHNNRLPKITRGMFDDLQRCNFLLLNNNEISHIEPGAMGKLIALKYLFFQYNKLKNITKEDEFRKMLNLNLAIFSDNHISTIEPGSFPKKHMTALVVYNNRLSSINITVFGGSFPKSEGVSIFMFAETLHKFYVSSPSLSVILNQTGFLCSKQRYCQPCNRGTYSLGDGISTGCVQCPAGGFYQDSVAAVGLTRHGNGCKECLRGTFVHPSHVPGKLLSNCSACPEGYYWFLEAPGFSVEKYEQLVENLKIESDNYDKNHSVYRGILPKAHQCQRAQSCQGGLRAKCATGYTGPLCAVCSRGYYKRLLECHTCPSKPLAAIQVSGVLCILIVLFLVLIRSEKKSKSSARASTDIFLSHVKILLGFYQVLSGILQAFAYVQWPKAVSSIGYYVRFVQLNILQIVPLICLFHWFKVNAYSDFVLGLAGNVICVAMPTTYYVTRKLWFYLKGIDAKDSLFASKCSCLRMSLFLLFVLYPSTCVKVFEILPASCHQLCPHAKALVCPAYLASDYTLHCFTKEHVLFYSAAYVALVYVIGFPVGLTLLLWKYYYKNLSKEGEIKEATPITLSLSFLHENYSRKCWYWEAIEMARKVILTAGVVFIGSQSRTQIGVAAMMSSGFAVLHALFRPIPDKFEDYLQMTSLLVTSFNLGIGVLLKVPSDVGYDGVDEEQDNIGLGILLVITNSLIIAVVAVRYLVGFGRMLLLMHSNPQCNIACCLTFFQTLQDAQSEMSETRFRNTANAQVIVGLAVVNTGMADAVNEKIEIELKETAKVEEENTKV